MRTAAHKLAEAAAGFIPSAKPITEREYLTRVLEFTAWDGQDIEQLAALTGPMLFGANVATRKDIETLRLPISADRPLLDELSPDSVLRTRKMLREQLAAHVAGVHRHDFKRNIYPQMLVLPEFVSSPEGNSARAIYLPADLNTAAAFALAVLFDAERGSGYAVGRCELETCGGYFLRSGTPGKPAKYHDACRQRLRSKSRHLKRRQSKIAALRAKLAELEKDQSP